MSAYGLAPIITKALTLRPISLGLVRLMARRPFSSLTARIYASTSSFADTHYIEIIISGLLYRSA